MTSNRPVSEMVERVALVRQIIDAYKPHDMPTLLPPTSHEKGIERAARAAIAAIPSAGGVEELGDCELCNKPLLLGQFVNHYDDVGTIHMDCERPFVKPSEPCASPNDGENMQTFVLLGEPALLEELK